MAEYYGADPTQMESLAAKFVSEAGAVQTLRTNLTNDVHGIIGSGYAGPAARRFNDAWDTQFSPVLQQLMDALTDASTELTQRLQAMSAAAG